MHDPHSFSDIGHSSVIHGEAGGVTRVGNENQRKTDIRLTDL